MLKHARLSGLPSIHYQHHFIASRPKHLGEKGPHDSGLKNSRPR